MGTERERAERFAEQLAEVFGDDLVSVGLYGSAARGEYREGVSDLNLLVVLRELDAGRLRRASGLTREWVEAGDPPPLIFSEAEWRGSADVFPIEYSDIRDAHLVLRGSDPFAEVSVRWEHLRLICEHELKGKKIQLRERYLVSAEAPEELGELLVRSISTFVTLFRAALRLAGEEPPRGGEAVVAALAARVGFDPQPLQAILRARAAGERPTPAADDPMVTGYLDAVTRTSDWLDRLQAPDGEA